MTEAMNMVLKLVETGTMPPFEESVLYETVFADQIPGWLEGKWGMTVLSASNLPSIIAASPFEIETKRWVVEDGAKDSAITVAPTMMLAIPENCENKEEAAAFINWFVNSEEANDIMMGERGTPASSAVREHMKSTGKLSPQQEEMFNYLDITADICGETPAPDPIGMSEINEAFKNAAYSAFYGQVSAEEAAKAFREEANAILVRNN